MTDDPRFYAWLDGELEPAEAAAVAARVEADPELARLAEQHRALNSRLKAAFDPIAAAPVPPSLLAAASPAKIVDFAEARARRRPAIWVQATALAASLALGLFTGATLLGQDRSLVRQQQGQLLASGDLKQALDVRLASAPSGTGPRIGLTFRDASGAPCRTFRDEATSGLACRAAGEWQVRALLQGEAAPSGDYRMAAGDDPRLLTLVDDSIAGEPLDAAAEAELVRRGWRD